MGKMIGIAVLIGLVFGGVYYWKGEQAPRTFASLPDGSVGNAGAQDIGAIYFYGAECPHCKDIGAFIDDNKLLDKIRFEKWEVWHNKKNAAEMDGKAKICGMDERSIGVPFLFAEGKCYVGTPEVEGYFKAAAGLPGGKKK